MVRLRGRSREELAFAGVFAVVFVLAFESVVPKLVVLPFAFGLVGLQLRDSAQLEIQVLDGSNVVSTQNLTAHYIALMTVAEDHWKVRVLQEAQ